MGIRMKVGCLFKSTDGILWRFLVYKPTDGLLADIPGAGGVSPADAPRSARALEAQFAEGWFKTITSEVFG